MELFKKTVSAFQPLTIFAERLEFRIFEFWLSYEYLSAE